MHAKLGQRTEGGSEAFFFTDLADAASDRMVLTPPVEARSAYGETRKPNWPALLLIAALHAVLLIGLVKYDIIVIKTKPTTLTVINITELPPPPIVEPPKPKVEPEIAIPPIASPTPIVQMVAPPPPVMVAPPPEKPIPSVIAAPPGPAMVDNIDERVIEAPMPRYPFESRRKKEQGTVVLRVVIGTDGRVAQVSISESSGFERLDKAALDAVKRWRWQPWTRNGQPVEVRGILPLPFVLKA